MKFSIPFSEKAKRKAYEASRFPPNWPSHLHNKCNVPTCLYPNAPQVADGTFNCLGQSNGFYCEGTYYVSPSEANSVMENAKARMAREDKAKRNANMAAEFEHQKVAKAQLDEEGGKMATEEVAAMYDDKRRLKNASTGSTADDFSFSASMARNAALLRRPTDNKPTSTTTKHHHTSSIGNQAHYMALYSPAVSHHCEPPIDPTTRSGQMPPHTSSRSQGSRSTIKYLPLYHPIKYNPRGKSSSRF